MENPGRWSTPEETARFLNLSVSQVRDMANRNLTSLECHAMFDENDLKRTAKYTFRAWCSPPTECDAGRPRILVREEIKPSRKRIRRRIRRASKKPLSTGRREAKGVA